MPVFGITLVSSVLALIVAEWLSYNLYIKSFITKIVVFISSYILKFFLYFILIVIFYWDKKIYFLKFEFVFIKILTTTLLLALFFKVIELKSRIIK